MHAAGKIALGHKIAFGEDAGTFDHIAKLTHVAIPARFLEHPLSSWRESDQQLAETL